MPSALALALTSLVAAGGQAVAAPGNSPGPRPAGPPTPGIISTVAGGVGGPGPATAVGISSPAGLAVSGGHFFVADGGSIRRVSQAGRLTTPAGTGVGGPLGDGVPAVRAGMGDTVGVAVGPAGSLLAADSSDGLVRMVAGRTGTFYGQSMTAGDVYTVAGGGTGGDGGPAIDASLNGPDGVGVDAAGNLLIAEFYGQRVRVVAEHTGTFYGQSMTAGYIYTIAGDGACGGTGDGGPATSARLCDVTAAVVDGAGNVLIADIGSGVRVVAESNGTFYGQSMTAGDIYPVASGFNYAAGMAVDGAGNVLIADIRNNQVQVIAESNGTFYGQSMTAGNVYTIAGDGTQGFAGDGDPATGAELSQPAGVAVDAAGNVLIGDGGNNRVRVVAEGNGTFYGQGMTAGDIYTVAGNGTGEYAYGSTFGFAGDGGPATGAEFAWIEGIAVGGDGNLAIADPGNNRIWVAAKSSGTFYGLPMTAGHIYIVAGDGTGGFSGDGGPAAGAELNGPDWVAVDPAGNLVIDDGGNDRIRVVANSTGTFYGQPMTAGDIYTVVGRGVEGFSGDGGRATRARLNSPLAVAVGAAGDLLIADSGNSRVRLVAERSGFAYGRWVTAGDIYTVAGNGQKNRASGDGGLATLAAVPLPHDAAVDRAGNLIIATGHYYRNAKFERLRVVAAHTGAFYGKHMIAGHIYTLAGGGTSLASGVPAISAELDFNYPSGVAVDRAGNLVLVSSGLIRVVAETTGTFYGVPMTAGDIYTVAGDGTGGFSGDGGPATSAEVSSPVGVAVDPAGNILFSDYYDVRVRRVTG